MRKLLIALSVLAAAPAMTSIALDQAALAEYPTKPINLWIGSRPGGSVDTLSRVLAKPLERELGQPIVVSSKPGGGGGGVCAGLLKNESPDGHTLCMIVNHNVTFRPQHMKVDYGFEDFRYIARVADFAFAIFTIADSPYSDWKGLLAHAKQKGGITFGTQVPIQRLVAAEIAKLEGFEIRPVPFKGGSKLMASILGGHLDIGISGGAYFPHLDAGKIKILAAAGSTRIPSIPDAPTLRDLGYDYAIDMFNLVAAPAGVSDEVVDKLDRAFAKAVVDPAYKDLIGNKMRMGDIYMGHKDVTEFLNKERAALGNLAAAMGQSKQGS